MGRLVPLDIAPSGGGRLIPLDEGFDIQENPSLDMEKSLDDEKKAKQQQALQQIQQAQAAEAEAKNPQNWTVQQTKDFIKENPPKTMQEEAFWDYLVDSKKKDEEAMQSELPQKVDPVEWIKEGLEGSVKTLFNAPILEAMETGKPNLGMLKYPFGFGIDVGEVFKAGGRIPKALLGAAEKLQKEEGIKAATKEVFIGREMHDLEKRDPTEIAQQMGDYLYGESSTNMWWEAMKHLPFATLGKISEIFTDPALMLTFQGVGKAMKDPTVAKFLGREIPAPKWLDDAISKTVEFSAGPLRSLAKTVKENRINAVVDQLYKNLGPQVAKNYESMYGSKPTVNDVKGLIKAKLIKDGIYGKSVSELQKAVLKSRLVKPGPGEVKAKPEVSVKPKTPAPKPTPRVSKVPEFKNTEEALKFGKEFSSTKMLGELKHEAEVLQGQYKLLIKQGKDAEAIKLASGQKQFVNEAIKSMEEKPKAGEVEKEKIDLAEEEKKYKNVEVKNGEKVFKTIKGQEYYSIDKGVIWKPVLGENVDVKGKRLGSKEGKYGTFYNIMLDLETRYPEYKGKLEEKQLKIENVLKVEKITDETFPIKDLFYRWFSAKELENEMSSLKLSSDEIMDKMVAEEAVKRGYDGIQFGNQEVVDLRSIDVKKEPKIKQEKVSPVESKEKVSKVSSKAWDVEMPKEPITKKRINKTEIIQWAEDSFKVPIRGRATTKGWRKAAGKHFGRAGIIRMRTWGELEPMTHEIAHNIDKKMDNVMFGLKEDPLMGQQAKKSLGPMWRSQMVPKKIRTKAKSELSALDYDQSKRRTSEGFAEYMRYLLTTDTAPDKAPVFHKWFTEEFLKLNKPLEKNLLQLREMLRTWQGQGAEARIRAQIDIKGEHTKIPGIRKKVAKVSEWIQRAFSDEFYTIRQVSEAVEATTGKKLRPSEDPYQMATFFKSKAGVVARTFVLDKAVDEMGNVTGPGLKEVLEPLGRKEVETWLVYGSAVRAKLWQERGLESGLDADDIEFIINKYQSEKFDKVLEGFTEWNNHFIDWIVDAGGLKPEAAKLIRALNPIYLPFKRAFLDELKVTKGSGTGKFVDQGSAIKRAKGSGRPFINPIEASIAQATELIQKAMKIRVANLIANLAEEEGLGGFVNKVPAPMEATVMSGEKLMAQLKSLVANKIGRTKPMKVGTKEVSERDKWGRTTKKRVDVVRPMPIYGASQADLGDLEQLDYDEIVSLFTQSKRYTGKDNIVTVWRNGKPIFYELHPDLYKALSGIDVLKRGMLLKILSPFARMLRLTATGLNVSFGLGSNPWRDALFAGVTSKQKCPIPFYDTAKGITHEVMSKPGDISWRFKKIGGELSGMMGYDRAATMAAYDELLLDKFKGMGKTLKVVRHPIDTLRSFLSFTEMGPRLNEVEKMYVQYRKDNPEWSDDDAFISAFNDAQDLTVNFTRSGFLGKRINEATAFFNASVQGPLKMFRSFKRDPVKFVVRGLAYMTALSLYTYSKNKDKQWYKNLPPQYKYSNFFFELGDDTIVRLPIPFELGTLFVSIPLMAMDYWQTKDPQYLEGVLKIAQGQFPDPVPSLFGPMIQVARNKNWLDVPIESKGMQFLPVTERKKAWSSKWSALASKGFNRLGIDLSPVQLDHLFQGYTGGITKQFKTTDIKTKSDLPFVGRFILRNPMNPRKQLNNFFTDFERLSQRKTAGLITSVEAKKLKSIKPFYYDLTRKYFKNLKKLRDKEGKEKQRNKIYEKMTHKLKQLGYE